MHSRIDLLKHLHTDLEFAINKAEEAIGVSALFSQFILTLVALDLLNTFFYDRREEWKHIRQKAIKSCKDFVELLNEHQREALLEIERQIRQAVAAKFAQQNNQEQGNALFISISDDSQDEGSYGDSPMNVDSPMMAF